MSHKYGNKTGIGRCDGLTMIELVVVMAVLASAIALSSLMLTPMDSPLAKAADLTVALLHEARAHAIATTSACRVSSAGNDGMIAEQADRCSSVSWAMAQGVDVSLPRGVTFDTVGWSVCFNSRGLADTNLGISMSHADLGSRTVEVLVGGTTRVGQ